MKAVLNRLNLSDKPIRLSDEYNAKMSIKTLFMNRFIYFLLKFPLTLLNLNLGKE